VRVALVFDGLGFGGIERVGVNYAKLFLDLGYEVDIYNMKPELTDMVKEFDPRCNFIHKKMYDLVVPDHYMLMVKRWRWGKYLYPFVYLASSILMYGYRLTMGKRKKYDISIAFAGHFRDLTFVGYDFILGEKKMCWLHGALGEYMASSCTYGDIYRNIKNLCVLSSIDKHITLNVCRYLMDLNIRKIYNPMLAEEKPIDEQKVKELKNTNGDFMLMVGRFGDDKDQKTVIEAMKILKEQYHRTEKMLFVGAGDTLEDCKKLAKELGVEEQVVFEGARYDVQNYYSAAKLFVHSSPAEGLPTVLLEAMQHDVPIVATDSFPGVSEILKGETYGMICEVANPTEMAKKINDMLSDEEKMSHYKKMGKERLLDFAEDKIRTELEDIIHNLK